MLVLTASLGRAAEPYTHQLVDGKTVQKPWRDVVGQRVAIEGLAWGAYEKGLGQRVILDGGVVYVKNADYIKEKANGKLVKIVGVLREERIGPWPPGAQGFGPVVINYFAIEVESISLVDKVTDPWMQQLTP